MKPGEAKELILGLVRSAPVPPLVVVDPASPDGDPAKFLIAGRAARAIHRFSGWHVPVNLAWFHGSYDPPAINRYPFHWYAFAIPRMGPWHAPHYLICDFLQVRQWVLDFVPTGNDYRDQLTWRADLRPFLSGETQGYFRWGDEPLGRDDDPSRVFELDNVATVGELPPLGHHVGTFGPGGESSAHKLLKLYVAAHPLEFGLTSTATAHVEYPFVTGDRVDVLFQNHFPDRTVVEVEVAGESNICIGIQQAIKYRSLAAVDAGYDLHSPRVGSLVAAYETAYPRAVRLAERYEVSLMPVDRRLVLAPAG